MSDYADLEIGLHHRDVEGYTVEFRYNPPDSDADIAIGRGQAAQVTFDFGELLKLANDPEAYGQKLTQFFFAEPLVQTTFLQARSSAQALRAPLRVRLLIGASAPELHDLRWETLRDPQDDSPLFTSENLLFSRYLSSTDWRPVRLRARGELRALAVVANPSDLADYNLAPIDVEREAARATQALGQIPTTILAGLENHQRPTLNILVDYLREVEFDILYLACHGSLVREEPWLWLEDDQGRAARLSGTELVIRIKELEQPPRLAVLASCESAGAGTGEALAALGPRLTQTGIPAVLAMQGKISMETAFEFMPVFFRELQRDGQIDRAVSVARGAVRQHTDQWIPALFMRLKSGRIWYIPGFGDVRGEFEKWQSLAGFIRDKVCTPIVGPGLIEALLGSRREMALRWAEKHGYPLATQDRDVLPRVAQYIMTRQSFAYLPVALREGLQDEIRRRHESHLPAHLNQAKSWSNAELGQALNFVSDKSRENNPEDPYQLLAELRLPIYINTSILDLLTHALVAAGAEPQVRICPWNKWIPKEKALYEATPTPEKPLVYHLFGNLSVPNSLVLAEDKYFDYSIGITLNKSLIPSAVRAALNSTSLLFLGFQMEDWEFRTFFRFLMAQEGRELLKFYSHAAAQIEPEEDRILDIKRARKYLEEYFEAENISIYWGSAEEFLKELKQHL